MMMDCQIAPMLTSEVVAPRLLRDCNGHAYLAGERTHDALSWVSDP